MKLSVEVCVDSVTSCLTAFAGGADRLVLCSSLPLGGLTPTDAFLKMVKRKLPDAIVYALIRPRPGDYVYGEDEIAQMEMEIESLKAAGADGFAFSLLNSDGNADASNCQRLIKLCDPLPVTFHRAFDLCAQWPAALSEICDAGIPHVLFPFEDAENRGGEEPILPVEEVGAAAAEDDDNSENLNGARNDRRQRELGDLVEPLIEKVKPLLSNDIWNDLSTKFYVTFWSLSLYDLKTPADSYKEEKQKLDAQTSMREADFKSSADKIVKKKREQERCKLLIAKFVEEEKKQQQHVVRTRTFLVDQKDSWSTASNCSKNDTVTQFLQLCIFPRMVLSPNDAVFCALFIRTIQDMETADFSTLVVIDRILCDVTLPLPQCSDKEASRYGKFVAGLLEIASKWLSDKKIYDEECVNTPGFVTVFRGSNGSSHEGPLPYEDFRHVCHKWQFKITKSFINCLEGEDNLLIRNSLIFLNEIAPFFPRVKNLGEALERRVERLHNEWNARGVDLYELVRRYDGMLKMNKKDWVPEEQFHSTVKAKANRSIGANDHGPNGTKRVKV